MLLFAVYLMGCFLAGVFLPQRNDIRRVLALLLVCVAIAATYYWIDSARALRASAPPARSEFQQDIPQFAVVADNAAPGPLQSTTAWAIILAWTGFAAHVLVMAWRPSLGLPLLLFFTLAADPVLAPWYPMTKGFSSIESIFFVSDLAIVSPLESLLLVAFGVWTIDAGRTRRLGLPRSAAFVTGAVFAGWLAAGLLRGLVSGGDANVALWELRGPAYVFAVLALTSRFIRTRTDIVRLMWAVTLALVVEACWITAYLAMGADQSATSRSFSDHATSGHANVAIVLMAAAWIYGSAPALRFGLPVAMAPLALSFLANQRRAALLALAVALGLLVPIGWRVNRPLVRRLVPVVAAAGVLWLVVGWNDAGPLGLPARVVKSVFDSNTRSLGDRESDYYRVLEDTNIIATIRSHPWIGVGFGQPFHFAVQLPKIPFIWWQYITHNAVLWIWIKTGVGGFLALMVFWGVAIANGAAISQRIRDGDLGAIAVTATLFVVMFAIYAYVDMAWDLRSTALLGAMVGLLVAIERLSEEPAA
jgi:hypothetical protein